VFFPPIPVHDRPRLAHRRDSLTLVWRWTRIRSPCEFSCHFLISFRQRPFAYRVFVTIYLAQPMKLKHDDAFLTCGSQQAVLHQSRNTLKTVSPGTLLIPRTVSLGTLLIPQTVSPGTLLIPKTASPGTLPFQGFSLVRIPPRTMSALTPEVSREAARGRSRRSGGLQETEDRLCEGTTLAELRPRAPAPAPSPAVSYLVDLVGTCAGARWLRHTLVRSRTPPGHAGHGREAGASPAEWPEVLTTPPTPLARLWTSVCTYKWRSAPTARARTHAPPRVP
jgi:hypothetical protein